MLNELCWGRKQVDGQGLSSINPFYMQYSPDGEGLFAGQHGYGCKFSLSPFLLSPLAY